MTKDTNVKLVSRKTLYKGFRTLEEITVQPKDLETGEFTDPISREFLVMRPAAVGVPYIPETDQVLLNQQFRMGLYMGGEENAYQLEVCSGIIDEGETPEEGMKREMKEETGCDVVDLEYFGRAYATPANCNELYYIYACRIASAEEAMHGEAAEGEAIKTHLVDASKAIEMLDNGEITNGAAVLALNWFARHHTRLKKKWGH